MSSHAENLAAALRSPGTDREVKVGNEVVKVNFIVVAGLGERPREEVLHALTGELTPPEPGMVPENWEPLGVCSISLVTGLPDQVQGPYGLDTVIGAALHIGPDGRASGTLTVRGKNGDHTVAVAQGASTTDWIRGDEFVKSGPGEPNLGSPRPYRATTDQVKLR